ncbi:DUF1657 domain-containing protein [Desulforamulus aeronauticus]|uniref:DUF1657 domain-containing protein n=1 Tax=Desulforamulus aeronauticus DSM 10349 TaxID=1121421 RepID=A0A1M6NXA8_9FIRM|nr:DUF1657 domain-containing protein [Desulforamulus aeronauticus]SHK00280.1 Protein of unknown function [Desulforamulus aeronauticus DSM 10349]
MTVASQVKQTVASLKGTKATLDAFFTIAQEEETRELLGRNNDKLNSIIDHLEQRVKTLEFEEPQYKGF